VTDLVNCILLASGCDQQVTEDDIRDPDNIQNRLSELQDLYQEVSSRRVIDFHGEATRTDTVISNK